MSFSSFVAYAAVLFLALVVLSLPFLVYKAIESVRDSNQYEKEMKAEHYAEWRNSHIYKRKNGFVVACRDDDGRLVPIETFPNRPAAQDFIDRTGEEGLQKLLAARPQKAKPKKLRRPSQNKVKMLHAQAEMMEFEAQKLIRTPFRIGQD